MTSTSNSFIASAINTNDHTTLNLNPDKIHTTQIPTNIPNRNFASVTAHDNTPKRDQAIVFNSIDGIPQKEYVLAIGQIVSPKNITFVSRISNNRFCIFLSNKNILDHLLDKTQSIKINDHVIQIRRLLNPAKRIIISNVCPSIGNQEILNALKNIDIIPMSQINHLKAGINIEGYEHIMSFRRQMYIKHDDIIKLPGSLIVPSNESQFRIFFTDDSITCYTCKSTGHTSNTCKKNISIETKIQSSHVPNETLKQNNLEEEEPELIKNAQSNFFQTSNEFFGDTDWLQDTDFPSIIKQRNSNFSPDTSNSNLPNPSINDQNKRPISDISSQKSPINIITPKSPTHNIKPDKKKAKIISRSNSPSQTDINKPDNPLNPAEIIFNNKNNIPLSFLQFKHIIDNFTNKTVNIHSLCKEVSSDIPTIINILEEVRPKIIDRAMKTKITKLANLLFQSLPPPNNQQ